MHAPFERPDRPSDPFARAVDHGREPRLTPHEVAELMSDHPAQLRDPEHRDQRQPEHHDRSSADPEPTTHVRDRRVRLGDDVHVMRHRAAGRLGHPPDLIEQLRLLLGCDARSRLDELLVLRHDPDDDRDDADDGSDQGDAGDVHVALRFDHDQRREPGHDRERQQVEAGHQDEQERGSHRPREPAPPPVAHRGHHARDRL